MMSSHDGDEEDVPTSAPEDDPWQQEGQDPWGRTTQPSQPSQPSQPAFSSQPQQRRDFEESPTRAAFSGMTLSGQEPPPTRIIHDIPPTWGGEHPEKELEPFLKLLRGWLTTTRTLKTQQGMTILHYSTGDLKQVINELDVDELTSPTSGDTVYKHIYNAYNEYLEKKLPQAIEQGIYDKDVPRRKGEGMLQYLIKRNPLFKLF